MRRSRKSISLYKRLKILLVTALFLELLTGVLNVAAHTEGKMQLASVPAGPYKVTVWTSPDPAESGEIHIAVAVTLAEDASPVLDAAVHVEVKSSTDSEVISALATTEDSENKFLYEAVIDVPHSGDYEVNISILGSDGADGETNFDLEVSSNSPFNWAFVVLIALLATAALILLFRGRRKKGIGAED